MVKTEQKQDPVITWLDEAEIINGNKWLAGFGNKNAKTLFILDKPTESNVRTESVWQDDSGKLLKSLALGCGINIKDVYFTYAVKYKPVTKNVTVKDIKICQPFLKEEIRRMKPELVVCMGSLSLKAVMGNELKLSDHRGSCLKYTNEVENDTLVFVTYSPSYIGHNPSALAEYKRDWEILSTLVKHGSISYDKTEAIVINNLKDLEFIVDSLLSEESLVLALDAEWHGKHWMDPAGYIRTVQFTPKIGYGIVVEFYAENKQLVFEPNNKDAIKQAFKLLGKLLTNPKTQLVGHNIISDGQWLISYGIDIRNNVVYDTMLAEHTINMTGPFGLEALTVKYTNLGRYDLELINWRNANNDDNELDPGYGRVPRDILNPYGAADVDTLLRIKEAQEPQLEPFKVPRGEYTSLWDTVMHTQKILYEIEMTGIRIDTVRLSELTKAYNTKLIELEVALTSMAKSFGVDDFNHRSTIQVSNILFNVLKLTPIMTTDGKRWEWMLDQCDEIASEANPSTNKTTLDILQDAHPFVKLMRDVRKIEHVCKTWLVAKHDPTKFNENTKGGGLIAKIWPDGKVHASFSQLKETARFSSRKPNLQNQPKRAERDIIRIFGIK